MQQSDKTYKIGQIVYVVLNKEGKVYPMQVIQEITKKSLNGTETCYMLRGNPSVNQTVMMSEISGEIFDTDAECRALLVQRAAKQLNKLVDNAVKKAGEWFPDGIGGEPSDGPSVATLFEPEQKAEPGTVLADLGDGTIAKVKLPPNVSGL
jgi:hypothetical protein